MHSVGGDTVSDVCLIENGTLHQGQSGSRADCRPVDFGCLFFFVGRLMMPVEIMGGEKTFKAVDVREANVINKDTTSCQIQA